MKTLLYLLPACLFWQFTPENPSLTIYSNQFSSNASNRSFFRLGEQLIVMEKLQERSQRPYVLLSLHSHERSVINVTRDFALANEVFFLRLLNSDQRNVTVDLMGENISFDPNRIFTGDGIKSSLKREHAYNKNMALQLQKFARFLFSEMSRELVVSIHEKDRDLVIMDYRAGGRFSRQVREAHQNPAWDAADLFITTEEKYFRLLKQKNCNVVWQTRGWAGDEGSLAEYCDRTKKPFIQIEVRPDHREHLRQMLGTVDELFK